MGKNLNKKYTFNSSNTGALSFSMGEVIAKETDPYSPVFIYGKRKSGKTYLLNAMGNLFNKTHKGKKVLYATAESFLKDLIKAIRKNNRAKFEEKYRKCDLLMIDDMQHFIGKPLTQEEFVKLIKFYSQNNQKLIFTSNSRYLSKFSEALKDEFAGSMLLEI